VLTRSIIVILIGTGAIVVASVLSCAVFVKPEPNIPVQPVVENIVNNDVVSPATIPATIPTTTSTTLPFAKDDDISELDTSDWKVYRNEEYGFEIKYPEDWDALTEEYEPRWHETVLGRIVISGSTEDPFYAPISITIRSNKERLSIKEWYKKNYPKEDISKLQKVKFNEIEGMKRSKKYNRVDSFYFFNEDKIYSISPLDSQKNIENQRRMTEKLLSTFKFINS